MFIHQFGFLPFPIYDDDDDDDDGDDNNMNASMNQSMHAISPANKYMFPFCPFVYFYVNEP